LQAGVEQDNVRFVHPLITALPAVSTCKRGPRIIVERLPEDLHSKCFDFQSSRRCVLGARTPEEYPSAVILAGFTGMQQRLFHPRR